MKLSLIWVSAAYASMFSSDLKRHSCSNFKKMKEVDKVFPELESCYSYSSLYFSVISLPCSTKCIDVTTKAAKYLTDACGVSKPSKKKPMISHREMVYSLWADPKAVDVVCKKGHHDRFCLEELVHYAPQLASRYRHGLSPQKVCVECNREIYSRFHNDPYSIPVVYYQIMNTPDLVLKGLGEYCNWN